MRALAVIPARYASERLPGKPLVRLGGRPMIELVYNAAVSCQNFERVVVATESAEVAATVETFGGDVELTSATHVTGTDRVAEVARRYPEYDVVANVQGDQPFVTAAMLSALLRPYIEGSAPAMTTLACPLGESLDPRDPNVVKVVTDAAGRAIYFSRSPIPHGATTYLHHLGLYAFRSDFLGRYPTLPEGVLERVERLEQLRVLEAGHEILVCLTDETVLEVNTAEDAREANRLLSCS